MLKPALGVARKWSVHVPKDSIQLSLEGSMNEEPSSQIGNLEIVQDHYDALNRGDIPVALQSFAPDVVSVEPDHFPHGGETRGLEAVTKLFVQGRSSWAEGGCMPQKLIPAGHRVVAFCQVHVRLNGQTTWIDGQVTDVITFQDGSIIHRRTFEDPQQAIVYAGLTTEDAGS
ncbi:MAG TPA: nuclear transport factor 2 family protein [Thermomicrobiales bacterium]|nr:nuclear transport factor 2 family protein [Thermomicrobiales bacterium]